jgi:hypothetical protein
LPNLSISGQLHLEAACTRERERERDKDDDDNSDGDKSQGVKVLR